MRIALLAAFAGRNCGGPEVFERETVRAIHAIAPEHDLRVLCLDLRGPGVIGVSPEKINYRVLQPPCRLVSMTATLPLVLRKTRPDVFHAMIVPPTVTPRGTIMQMPCSSLILHPEFFPPLIRMRLRFLLHRALPRASYIICPSRHVREVMMEHFGIAADKLPVIHPGANPSFRLFPKEENCHHIESRFGIRSPYFLFSGRWEARKNIMRTIEAFGRFKQQYRSDHKLVFTGGQSWHAKEAQAMIERHRIGDSFIDLGKTPFTELPPLYAGAEALVFASLWEGFGMPIVEAMMCGTPVITSNLSAMPETAGGAALLVDPYSVEELAGAMQAIVSNRAQADAMRRRGLEWSAQFTWERAARQTLRLYEAIAN